MSHTSVLKTVQINDIQALYNAVEFLKQNGVNCELLQNARPRMYYRDQHGVCDYVLKLNNASYDVGFAKQNDGSYVPVFDSWNGIIAREIGADEKLCPPAKNETERQARNITRLLNAYVLEASKIQLEQQGYYDFSHEVQPDGTLALIVNS